jgi:hypothetical protein
VPEVGREQRGKDFDLHAAKYGTIGAAFQYFPPAHQSQQNRKRLFVKRIAFYPLCGIYRLSPSHSRLTLAARGIKCYSLGQAEEGNVGLIFRERDLPLKRNLQDD